MPFIQRIAWLTRVFGNKMDPVIRYSFKSFMNHLRSFAGCACFVDYNTENNEQSLLEPKLDLVWVFESYNVGGRNLLGKIRA